MESKIISFMLQCDKSLNIINTYWCDPVSLISPYQKNLMDLFSMEDKAIVKNIFIQRDSDSDIFGCQSDLLLLYPKLKISICGMQAGDSILIHGIQIPEGLGEDTVIFLKTLVHRFMSIIRLNEKEIFTDNELMIRSQFEEIQRLNNDLLNTKRQLVKANATLNRLNSELNNRLVKDALTGLVSRYQYREEIEMTIRQDPDLLGVFLFIDIDDFKSVNDTYGHHIGDEYLKSFANRINMLPYRNKIAMRIAGDEFGVYIHGYDAISDEDLEAIWMNIKEIVVDPQVSIGSLIFNIRCSVGMSVYGSDTTELYDLIEYADFAMYEAKRSGKNDWKRFNKERYVKNKNIII